MSEEQGAIPTSSGQFDRKVQNAFLGGAAGVTTTTAVVIGVVRATRTKESEAKADAQYAEATVIAQEKVAELVQSGALQKDDYKNITTKFWEIRDEVLKGFAEGHMAVVAPIMVASTLAGGVYGYTRDATPTPRREAIKKILMGGVVGNAIGFFAELGHQGAFAGKAALEKEVARYDQAASTAIAERIATGKLAENDYAGIADAWHEVRNEITAPENISILKASGAGAVGGLLGTAFHEWTKRVNAIAAEEKNAGKA